MNQNTPQSISLAGKWRFCPDEAKEGIKKEFYKHELADTVMLPGTTEENRKGCLNSAAELSHLTRLYPYRGFAWYQRQIHIKEELKGCCLKLLLERTKITHVWLDDQYLGTCDSLCTPHVYDLPQDLPSGSHRLTIMVDNENLPPIGDPHQISDHTQTNWNGILGRIELQITAPVFMQDIQIYPDCKAKKARVLISVRNMAGKSLNAVFKLSASSSNTGIRHQAVTQAFNVTLGQGDSETSLEYYLGEEALSWDEYNPAIYLLAVELMGEAGGKTFHDTKVQEFGLKSFTVSGTQFSINNRKVFLRGTHDGCVFPLTGYAPMDIESWINVFKIAKSYGLNHYRFHSWCPPEAAFAAADRMGFYLQPELPNWASFEEPGHENYNREHEDYLRKEGKRILKAYGNHPSFVMFSLGNELFGSTRIMEDIVRSLRSADNRHLYAQGSNNFYSKPELAQGDDFWVTMRAGGPDRPVRGSFSYADLPLGHIQGINTPSTMVDYTESIKDVNMPVVGHEIGQFQSFPDLDEIPEYTGVLRAKNLEAFRERLKEKGMLYQAKDFLKASGKLAVICYREDIEAALRTPGFGGFQLLDIKDFPGQGTAMVGILNAFMKSKGFIEPEEWREFCSDTVLLARFPKYTYWTEESFRASVEVAHYGRDDLADIIIQWELLDSADKRLTGGEFGVNSAKQGTVTFVGRIETNLAFCAKPERLNLILKIKNTGIRNRYPVWVYPAAATDRENQACVCNDTAEAIQRLKDGRNVLLIPDGNKIVNCVDGMFASDFWCYPMFRNVCEKLNLKPSPGTLGILCNPEHPLFRSFPTEFHSNWQWWSIMMNSHPVILDDMPHELQPVVQVIDNFERNHRLGLIFEARVEKGNLLVCSSDLNRILDRPEGRQLFNSLLEYVQSQDFKPAAEIDIDHMASIIK